ncbi:MAG TPA: Holliday junction resolvase RuvX [Clostridiales bacterium]|nr:Holliday junction resolvase RuvX [Clostridiales bacterium]
MRLLGLDIGDKRIGIAVSDALGWTAQGIESYTRSNNDEDIKHIHNLIDKYNVEKLVVGLPKNMDGSLGPQSEKIKTFCQRLCHHKDIEIIYWDERLSTMSAEKMLISGDMPREKRKKVIDKVAAVIILQNYLDMINNKKQ